MMGSVVAFKSVIISLMVAFMSAFTISPEIKIKTVDTAARAVAMALRSSQIPVTYEGIKHNSGTDTVSVSNIKLQVPLPMAGDCKATGASGKKDPKTLFYEKMPCAINVSVADITIRGLELGGQSSETTSIHVNDIVIDLSSLSSGEMLALKRMLQLDDELRIEAIGIGLGYDILSDQITAELDFGIEGLGSIESLITVSSVHQDSFLQDQLTGQLERVELTITDDGMIETAGLFASMSTGSGAMNLSDMVTALFAASPLQETPFGDLSELYPNSDQNIFELAYFFSGYMTLSCVRENPHQIVFSEKLAQVGPTMLLNMLCEKVSVYGKP